MTATIVGFRWLDLLEKEFDTSFVDLESIIEPDNEFADEDYEWIPNAKKKMATLASCFAQLAHKSQTIFQLNAKLEAEMVNLRHDLTESEALSDILKEENKDLVTQLHSLQIQLHKQSSTSASSEEDMTSIQNKLEEDIRKRRDSCLSVEIPRKEIVHLQRENDTLRNQIMLLQGELTGAQIATKYLDKELAGRVQQLQLLRNGIDGNQNEKVWRQLECEIQLHRHKTCVRACRKNLISSRKQSSQIDVPHLERPDHNQQHRLVTLKRANNEDIGLSVTGGQDQGLPVLISVIHSPSPASACKQLCVGDAIMSVNGINITQFSHADAVNTLSSQQGNVDLEVFFVLTEDDGDDVSDGSPSRFKIFDDDIRSLTSSIHSTQNGRLSRASIDSVRGSTENILTLSRVQSDLEDETSEVEAGEKDSADNKSDCTNGVSDRLSVEYLNDLLVSPSVSKSSGSVQQKADKSSDVMGYIENLGECQNEATSSSQNLLAELHSSTHSKRRSDSNCSRLTLDNEETILFNGNY